MRDEWGDKEEADGGGESAGLHMSNGTGGQWPLIETRGRAEGRKRD